MYETLSARPSLRTPKSVGISIGIHVAVFLLILLSPLVRRQKKAFKPAKFFKVVDVTVKRPRRIRPPKRRTKPSPVAQTVTPKTGTQKMEALSEPDYALPTEVKVTQNFQYDWYLSHLTSKVEQYWKPPRGLPGEEDLSVIVYFRILRNGQIANLEIRQSSGVETLDRLGSRSIRRAAPFPRLPPRFGGEALEVKFTLNYLR